VVKAVAENENVKSAGCVLKNGLCLARAEAGAVSVNNKGLFGILAPLFKIVVNAGCEVFAASHTDYGEIAMGIMLGVDFGHKELLPNILCIYIIPQFSLLKKTYFALFLFFSYFLFYNLY
jgi:hypothetical protein